jgi:methionine aminotransferase
LLDKISNLTLEKYNRNVNTASELLITSGATQAVFATINALVNHGEEVIILDPSYDSYEPSVLVAGGKSVRVNLNDDFTPNFNAIEDAISVKTKLIVINNPHNPTGKIWSETEFVQFESLLEKYPHVLVLADEVYEYISFLHPHISFNTRTKLIDRTIVISSFGKSLHVTGWKVGYLIAPEYLMTEIKKVHQFVVFSVSSIAQHSIAEYLNFVDFNEIATMYKRKKEFFQNLLLGSKFELLPCEGTYFQLVKYSHISTENDFDFAKKLTQKHGVAAIPISVFNHDKNDKHLLRFCFAKDDDTLIRAAERLHKL